MAEAEDLMGLGENQALAQIYGKTPVLLTATGSTAGDAAAITNGRFVVVNGGTSGVRLPQAGGDGTGGANNNGALMGDMYVVANITGATIVIFANNNGLGSAVTIYGRGTSAVGTTGFSAQAGIPVLLMPVTISTWIAFASA